MNGLFEYGPKNPETLLTRRTVVLCEKCADFERWKNLNISPIEKDPSECDGCNGECEPGLISCMKQELEERNPKTMKEAMEVLSRYIVRWELPAIAMFDLWVKSLKS